MSSEIQSISTHNDTSIRILTNDVSKLTPECVTLVVFSVSNPISLSSIVMLWIVSNS